MATASEGAAVLSVILLIDVAAITVSPGAVFFFISRPVRSIDPGRIPWGAPIGCWPNISLWVSSFICMFSM